MSIMNSFPTAVTRLIDEGLLVSKIEFLGGDDAS